MAVYHIYLFFFVNSYNIKSFDKLLVESSICLLHDKKMNVFVYLIILSHCTVILVITLYLRR